MSITPGHFKLTPEQRHFKQLLGHCPRLESYWDFDKRDCDIDRLRESLGVLSHGESIMARFLVGVWFGQNKLEFDLIDAVKTLDEVQLQIILDWTSRPVFP